MPVILATGEQGMGVDNYPGLARGLMATMSKHLANAEKNIGITNEQDSSLTRLVDEVFLVHVQ